MSSRVFYTQVKMVNKEIKPVERELEFVGWTPDYLVVKYPENSVRVGMNWAMDRKTVNKWLEEKVLRIEGNVPEWASVI